MRPIGRLSGGEQQRLRVAQALVADPVLILADEPLLSLDLAHQRGVVDLLDARRRASGTPVVFVTHDVNPVLHTVDRVLYLAPGSWAIGTPDEVLTSETLSAPLRNRRRRPQRARPRRRGGDAGRPARPPRGERPLMFSHLLAEHFVQTALWAGAVAAVVSGAIGVFVVARGMSFAVHAISELGFTGAAGALVIGINPVTGILGGSLLVGLVLGLLSLRGRERDSAIGAVLAFGLGLGVLFLWLYQGSGDRRRRTCSSAASSASPTRNSATSRSSEPSSCSASRCSTGRSSSRASTRRSQPRAACRSARSRSRSSSCSR